MLNLFQVHSIILQRTYRFSLKARLVIYFEKLFFLITGLKQQHQERKEKNIHLPEVTWFELIGSKLSQLTL